MARIFISYSRADKALIERLVKLLRRVRRDDVFWYDGEITGGDDWWALILSEIHACDVFMYLLSNDSVESDYCKAEFREALRLHKICLPVIVRPKTQIGKLPPDLQTEISKRHWANLENGTDDAVALSELYAALGDRIRSIPASTPAPLAPTPVMQPQVTLNMRPPAQANNRLWIFGGGIVAMIALIAVIIAIIGSGGGGGQPIASPTTQVAVITEELSPTPSETEQPTHTTTPTETPSAPTDEPTPAPTVFEVAGLSVDDQIATRFWMEETLTAQVATATGEKIIADMTATQASIYADMTATATLWDIPATREAEIQTGIAMTRAFFNTQIALSFTPTNTLTHTPTFTPTATPTTPPGYAGGATITANEQWTPVEQDFDGVTMVLVPAGCFMMGEGEQAHEQCFDTPFWIDKYEVTNGQFAEFGGVAGRNSNWTGDDLPRERITWFEARDYCQNNRGDEAGEFRLPTEREWEFRLPTEREWEYASRGPNNLIYPWGNDFVADNVVYGSNSNSRTAPVGSRENGVSWVGAMDMSGNVWEWVSSLYVPYPYSVDSESASDNSNYRVLRGGSWDNSITTGLRAPSRVGLNPSGVNNYWGFRCVLSYSP